MTSDAKLNRMLYGDGTFAVWRPEAPEPPVVLVTKIKPKRRTQAHPFYARAYRYNERARKRSRKACLLTPEDLEFVYDRDGGICVLCGSSEKYQFDHIVPLCKKGANTVDNLRVLCARCNMNKMLDEDAPAFAEHLRQTGRLKGLVPDAENVVDC
jgi:5-methylcytosine-specific restriction endonuclease McrA